METAPPPAFATLLRHYRQAAGLSQEELAERAGLSARTVGDLERGGSHTPRKDTIELLVQALDLGAPERAALAAAARRLSTGPPARPGPVDLSSPPLVGRRRVLVLLEGHLRGQGPPALLLAGQPGIGKTRLLHAALPRAAGGGLRVLEGGCQRRGGHEPYAPLLGALQRHLSHASPARRRTELAGCAWLVRLLPELAGGSIAPLPAWMLPPEQERRLMVDAVLRFLANVAGPGGTLLVLDDLQWAGPDALDLLTALVRAAAEVPLRVLGAYRDTEVGLQDPLAVTLADLAHAGLASQYTLAPLPPEEMRQLLEGLLEGVVVHAPVRNRLVQRTGGVPFYLVSCVRGLQTGVLDAQADAHLPWDLAHSIRQRVAALPQAAREVVSVAAVAGRTVPRPVLAAVVGRPEEELLTALEAACRMQVLEEEGAEAYHFLHDVTREVVEADLGAARRMVLHRHVAEALERELKRLDGMLLRGLAATAGLWPDLQRMYEWVWQAAHLLANEEERPVADLQAAYADLVATMAAQRDRIPTLAAALDHFLKVTASYWSGLFACYRVPDLPRTNNDLEHYFGTARYHERRASGRKQAASTLVVRGAVRVVAAVATQLHPFSAADLRPHDLEQWRAVRQAVQYRHATRRAQRRFQRDPDAYLATLEELLLHEGLPP